MLFLEASSFPCICNSSFSFFNSRVISSAVELLIVILLLLSNSFDFVMSLLILFMFNMYFHLTPFDQHVPIYCRGMIMRLLVIILLSFLLIAAVVHKQMFSGGPLELFLPCVSFNVRGNTVGCARDLSTDATYNYAFSFTDGYCSQCRVIDTNVTATEDAPLRGPHFFSVEHLTTILQNFSTKSVRKYFHICTFLRVDGK